MDYDLSGDSSRFRSSPAGYGHRSSEYLAHARSVLYLPLPAIAAATAVAAASHGRDTEALVSVSERIAAKAWIIKE